MKFIIWLPQSNRYVKYLSTKHSERSYLELTNDVNEAVILDEEDEEGLEYVSLKDLYRTDELFVKQQLLGV